MKKTRNLNETCEGMEREDVARERVGSGNCTGEKRKRAGKKGGDEKRFLVHEEARFLSDQTGDSMADCSASGTHVDPPAFFRDAWLPAPRTHAPGV